VDVSIDRRAPFGSNPRVGERGSDTQRRILEGALSVFGEVGFSEARVELIADAAGCSRPAFYQYFSSKDDVFWVLAAELGREMVALAERLEPVTSDAAGLRHLTAWIDSFMDLHEAWAPVFDSFQIASRDHERRRTGSSGISDRTGSALLRAFGRASGGTQDAIVARGLVAALIRCSFFAEHTRRLGTSSHSSRASPRSCTACSTVPSKASTSSGPPRVRRCHRTPSRRRPRPPRGRCAGAAS
jgi:AcrR family transcriptional regulator